MSAACPRGRRRARLSALLIPLAALLVACSGSGDDATAAANRGRSDDNCHVQLFDGGRYAGNNIFVRGAGEHPSLERLPDTTESWDRRARSFKTGARTRVTFWSAPGFEGQASRWSGRVEQPAMAVARSMKIACKG